ncbi:hypothetical protein GW17_00039833, partial [Ensete ventricosum]
PLPSGSSLGRASCPQVAPPVGVTPTGDTYAYTHRPCGQLPLAVASHRCKGPSRGRPPLQVAWL